MAEVHLVLLHVALHDTVGAHVHVKVETGHRSLQAFYIEPAVLILALHLLGGPLEVLDERHDATGCIQVGVVVLVLKREARLPRSAVQRGTCLVGNEQVAVQSPVQVVEREVGIPFLGTQVDVTLGMQARAAVALAVIHAQTLQVQVTHVAVGSEHIVVVADGAVGVDIQVTAAVSTLGIDIGVAAAQLAAGLEVAVVGAVIAHAGQIDGGIGPCRAAVGKVKAVTAGVDAAREVPDVVIGQERLDGEIIERGIHVVVLVAHVVVTVATQGSATRRDAQVAGYPLAAFLVDLAAHLHGRQFHVLEAQHLVQHTGVPQVHLGIEVSLHAVHVGGVIDGTLALDAADAGHIGIQRMDIDALLVTAGFGLDAYWLVVGDVLECLACLGNEFLDLVQVDLAVGVDGGFAIGLAIEHILVHMGIHLDVTALGLEFHVVEVQAVLVLIDRAAGIFDLQTAAFLPREVLDGNLEVFAVILEVVDIGIDILDLDVIRIECGARLIGFFAGLGVFALAVFHAHLARVDLPGLVIFLFFRSFLGHGMVLAVLLGILLAGVLIIHVGFFDVKFTHIDGLIAGIDLDVLGFGMAHLGIEFIDGGFHVHLEIHIVGRDLIGIDFPGLAGLLVRVGLFLLGLIAHLGLATLEGSIAHIDLVVIQIDLGLIDFSIINIHIQVHRAVIGLDLALGALE